MKKIVLFFLTVWVLFLFYRSGLYLKRIVSEASNPPAKKQHLPHIKPCLKKASFSSTEEQQLFRYRSLGAECKN